MGVTHAPTRSGPGGTSRLAVVEPADPVDLPALQARVDELAPTVESITEELNRLLTPDGFIAVPKLREDVDELQRAVGPTA